MDNEFMNNFIIPRKIGEIFRIAMIPEFPSLFKRNPGDVFKSSYSCDDFFIHVDITYEMETLDQAGLSIEDLKFIDSRFQHSIGNWLMNKKAQPGNDQINGDIDTLVKDIFARHKVRDEDYKKLVINLKSLSALYYYVSFSIANKEQEHSFHVIDGFKYDEDDGSFIAILGENIIGDSLFPQVVNEAYGKELGPYTSKTSQDIYPKQDRYEFNMRQYLATIKNSKIIPKTGADYLLEQFGYRSHYRQFKQKYRNEEAEILMHKYITIARQYGLTVQCHKGSESLKDIRERFYSTTPKNAANAKLPTALTNALIKRLAKLIKETGSQAYEHEKMYTNLAKKFIRQHGFKEVKNAYDAKWNGRGKFSFGDLKAILSASRRA